MAIDEQSYESNTSHIHLERLKMPAVHLIVMLL